MEENSLTGKGNEMSIEKLLEYGYTITEAVALLNSLQWARTLTSPSREGE